MSRRIMQGGLAGVIATYLSYTDKGDLNVGDGEGAEA